MTPKPSMFCGFLEAATLISSFDKPQKVDVSGSSFSQRYLTNTVNPTEQGRSSILNLVSLTKQCSPVTPSAVLEENMT